MMLYENTRTVYDLVHNAAAEHGDRVFLQYEENGIIFRVALNGVSITGFLP